MSEEKYDLNESAKGIGQLYPVLVDKKGRTIDGFHRLQANPSWRIQPLDHIDTDEKLLLARCVANWHRRQVGREEKTEWINGLAKIYKEQGLKIEGKHGNNEILDKLVEVLGLNFRTIRQYLVEDFKQRENLPPIQKPSVPASQRIESTLGKDYVERYREEVLAEEKPKIKQQIREELLESPEFRLEAIHKDREEMVKQHTEERGVPQIWKVEKIDEGLLVIEGHGVDPHTSGRGEEVRGAVFAGK